MIVFTNFENILVIDGLVGLQESLKALEQEQDYCSPQLDPKNYKTIIYNDERENWYSIPAKLYQRAFTEHIETDLETKDVREAVKVLNSKN